MKRILKIAGILIAIPVGLFIIVATLLYIPAIQNYLVDKIAVYASEKTNTRIQIDNIRLGFPLNLRINGVEMISSTQDTLLRANQLRVDVQLLPLLRKQIEIDGFGLNGVQLDTKDLISSVALKGSLGELYLSSHGVDLTPEIATVNKMILRNTDLEVILPDSVPPDTTASSPTYWKILLNSLECENVRVGLQMSDTTRMAVALGDLSLKGGVVDLLKSQYEVQSIKLSDGAFSMDSDTLSVKPGIDFAHLDFQNLNIELDSLLYGGRNINAAIKHFSTKERSGLDIRSLTGTLHSDEKKISVPDLRLETSDSYLETKANIDWNALSDSANAVLNVALLAELGKQDVMLLAGGMPSDFVRAYPNSPITFRAGLDGNMRSLRLIGLQSGLKGVYDLNMTGNVTQVLDSIKRNGELSLEAKTYDLDCVKALMGVADSTLTIPSLMTLNGDLKIEGKHVFLDSSLEEGSGRIGLVADYWSDSQKYDASLVVDSIAGHDFLPHDSLRYVSLSLDIEGHGFDIYHPATSINASLLVDGFQYANYDLSGINMQLNLLNRNVEFSIDADNVLMNMHSKLSAALQRRGIDGHLLVNVPKANLKGLNISEFPLDLSALFTLDFKTNFQHRHWFEASLENLNFHTEKSDYKAKNFYAKAFLKEDSTLIDIKAGDLNLHMSGTDYIASILNKLSGFGDEFLTQVKDRRLDQNKLKSLLPELCIQLRAGADNPVNNYLSMSGFKYQKLFLDMDTSPLNGFVGHSYVYSLHVDSLQLDTVRWNINQDSLGVKLFAEVRNAPTNRQFVFDSKLNAFLHPKGAGLELNYFDGKGEQGVHLGIGIDMIEQGFRVKFFPERPIIAFQTFTLNRDNYLSFYKDGRIDANITLDGDKGTDFQLYSTPNIDALHDLTASIHRINLGELMGVLPYLPKIEGWLNAEIHYMQSNDKNLSVAVETSVDSLVYEKNPLGDVACSAIYLPKDNDVHFVDARISLDNEEVAALNGDYRNVEEGSLDASLSLTHFPLKLANGFIPDKLVALTGKLDGEVTIKGNAATPKIDGQLSLDSVSLESDIYGARFRLDNRPVLIKDNKMNFDNFSVYTRGDNPFTLTGSVDFSELSNMMFDLRMVARNYELINAPRKRHSVLYGKVYVDIYSSLQGQLDNLKMRGNINVQGSTDVTYVLKDSPLTVEDRLSGLVTFVDFRDTTKTVSDIQPIYNAGGVDVLMTLHIDEGALVHVNLSEDGESYVSLNGGGNLSMQYTPQGEFLLSGRYTVVNGQMKYALPVIPLKTFSLKNGSYVEFNGDPMNPSMNIAATERVRSTVTENDVSRSVNFDVGVSITNTLENMGLEFTLEAPEDTGLQNQLVAMSKEERGKLAVAMLATGMYLGEGNSNGKSSGGFSANSALNSFLQSEITNIAGSALKTVDITLGMEDATSSDGSQHTDYSFRFAKRFWNNRISIVIGGRISTGNDDPNSSGNSDSFIDDISLEWRLDDSGTRYIRIFHNTNYDSMLEGEITETGAGIVLRKKVSKLGELFIFRKKKQPARRTEQPISSEQ